MTREDKDLYVRMRTLQILLELESLEHLLSTDELEALLAALDKSSRELERTRQGGENRDSKHRGFVRSDDELGKPASLSP
jgi:hypothetical protein